MRSDLAAEGGRGDDEARLRYVLITPARNEEAFIEETIRSVVRQSVRPEQWVIVSDGSTDSTDAIVTRYATGHSWIDLVRMPEHRDRSFAAKVACFNAGVKEVRTAPHDIIGNLDADISVGGPDYFEFLLNKFAEDPKLGIAGTPFVEEGSTYDYRFASLENVSGACQLFRRECYEAIGGYASVHRGGIDAIAVISARMKGWRTQTFPERVCFHHRKMGTAGQGYLRARFNEGRNDYALGWHPLWEVLRAGYQMSRRPLLLGGSMLLAGYAWAMIRRMERPISRDVVAFVRREQLARLNRLWRRRGVPT